MLHLALFRYLRPWCPSFRTHQGHECVTSLHLHPTNEMKIAIIGFGCMGVAIAAELLRRGCIICVYDSCGFRMRSARQTIQATLMQLCGTYFNKSDIGSMLRRFNMAHSLEQLVSEGYHTVIEVASETLAVKQHIFRDLSALLMQHDVQSKNVFLCSNTMNLPVSLIAAHVNQAYARRCVSLRFLHPVLFIDEVVLGCENYGLVHEAILKPLKFKQFSPSRADALRLDMSTVHQYWKHQQAMKQIAMRAHDAHMVETQRAVVDADVHDDTHKLDGAHLEVCIVCLERPRSTIIVPCGHTVLCQVCANLLISGVDVVGRNETKCPLCVQDGLVLPVHS